MNDGDDAKLVNATCILTPNRTAIEIEEEKVTFMEPHEKVVSVCEHLTHVGVERGQKVAVLMKNGMEMITVIHALSYVGAVAVLLNTRLSREELLWQMDDAEVVCLVTDQDFDAKDVPVYSLAEVMNAKRGSLYTRRVFFRRSDDNYLYVRDDRQTERRYFNVRQSLGKRSRFVA